MMAVGFSITSRRYGLCDKTEDARTGTTARVAKVWVDDEDGLHENKNSHTHVMRKDFGIGCEYNV
jgi:hypothetical protein